MDATSHYGNTYVISCMQKEIIIYFYVIYIPTVCVYRETSSNCDISSTRAMFVIEHIPAVIMPAITTDFY